MNKIYLILFCLFGFYAQASHSIGGTISWRNVGAGKFVFELKLVHKCNGPSVTPLAIRDLEGPLGKIPVYLADGNGYTPTCEYANGIWCNSLSTSGWVLATMVYRSDTITVTGVPPVSGWRFYFKDASRPSNTVNMTVGSNVQTEIYAIMYPETVTHNLSSPYFVDSYDESITPYNHVLTNQAFAFSNQDSLYYKLMQPITGTGSPYSFTSGFNYLEPFPDQMDNGANGPMVFNPYTGSVNVDVQVGQEGYYGYTVAVEQWRVLQSSQGKIPFKVSEVRKDNLVPLITTSNTSTNSAPDASIDTAYWPEVKRLNSSDYLVLAEVGDTVKFFVQALDTDLDTNNLPQFITFDAKGIALDSSWGGWELYNSVPEIIHLSPGFVNRGSNVVSFGWRITPDLVDSVDAYHAFKFTFTDDNCMFTGRSSVNLVVRVAAHQDTASSGVGIKQIAKSKIEIFPNPVSESFVINGLAGESTIELLDIQGRVIETHHFTEKSAELKRNSLPSGVYFVKIQDSNTTTIKKVFFK